jgi:hypothetical protein
MPVTENRMETIENGNRRLAVLYFSWLSLISKWKYRYTDQDWPLYHIALVIHLSRWHWNWEMKLKIIKRNLFPQQTTVARRCVTCEVRTSSTCKKVRISLPGRAGVFPVRCKHNLPIKIKLSAWQAVEARMNISFDVRTFSTYKKWTYPRNSRRRPIRLSHIEDATLSRESARRWRWESPPYPSAASIPPETFFNAGNPACFMQRVSNDYATGQITKVPVLIYREILSLQCTTRYIHSHIQWVLGTKQPSWSWFFFSV